MYIEQIYTGCLAHGAYYIESNGEAAIIDPLRKQPLTFKWLKIARPGSSTFWKPIFMQILFQAMWTWLKNRSNHRVWPHHYEDWF